MDSPWAELVASLAGAFTGATIAFALERYARRRQARASEIMDLHRALFVLGVQKAELRLIERTFMKHEKTPHRWRVVPAVNGNPRPLFLDLDRLLFLVDQPAAGALRVMFFAEAAYSGLVRIVEARNEQFYLYGHTDAGKDAAAHLSALSQVQDLTEEIYLRIGDALERNRECVAALSDILGSRYKSQPVTVWDLAYPTGEAGQDRASPPS